MIVPLSTVAEVVRGVTFDKGEALDTACPGAVPLLRAGNIADRLIVNDDLVWVPSERVSPDQRMRPGDIAVCMSSGSPAVVGKSALLSGYFEGSVGAFCAILRPRVERVLPEYLSYFLRSKRFRDWTRQSSGSAVKNIRKSELEAFPLELPERDEQRRTVDLLSRAEGIVRLRHKAQQKAAELIPAIFIDMFGDPATNPKGWPVVKLGELLSSIDSGHSPKCSDRHRGADEWGVLRLGAVSRCEYDEHEHKTLPRDIVPDSSIEVKSGDLLFSRKNTAELVGASAYVWTTGGRVLLPDLIFRLQLVEAAPVNAIYLWKLLTTHAKRSALTRLATGSAGSMPNISKERLRTLPVEVPKRELQMKFADLVKEVRSIRQQQQAAIEKAEAVFASLLADAFSGA